MSKIIILDGPKNSGKTSTMNIVLQLIYKQLQVTHPPHTINYANNSTDFSGYLYFNGKKIVFKSAGDSSNDVCQTIKSCTNYDVLICTNREFIRPRQLVPPQNIIQKKKSVNRKDIWWDNFACANQIISKI